MSWGSTSTIVPPPPPSRQRPLHRLAACVVGAAAFLFTAATTVFTALDSYAFFTAQPRIASWFLAVAASAVNLLSLICLAALLVQNLRRHLDEPSSSKWTKLASLLAIVITIAASVSLTLATFVLKTTSDSFKSAVAAEDAQPALKLSQKYTTVEWVILGLSIVAQCIFYILAFRKGPAPPPEPPQADPESFEKIRQSMINQARQANIMMSFNITDLPSPYLPSSPFHSPAHSTISLASSLKSPSLVSSPKPVALQTFHSNVSRTRLLRRKESDSAIAAPLERPQEDGFDTWDTSSVDQQTRDAVMGTPRLNTRLEPIPGSRSQSPADELSGTLNTSLYADRRASIAESILEPPQPLYTTASRPATPTGDESHIHPLFRAESPVPPPRVTPATVITAAPLSGQTIPAFSRPASGVRSRSQSQPVHPGSQPAAVGLHTPERPRTSRTVSPSSRNRATPPSKSSSPKSMI